MTPYLTPAQLQRLSPADITQLRDRANDPRVAFGAEVKAIILALIDRTCMSPPKEDTAIAIARWDAELKREGLT